ncbi:MAG: signal peptidase II [Thermoleophilaceae bacterium]
MGATTAGVARAAAAATVVAALDQATKQAVVHSIARDDSRTVFYGVDLTNTRNTGVAFGALEGGGIVVGVLIALSLTALLVYFALNAAAPWLWLPVGLILGGAVGNLVDRVRIGAVIDFIDPAFWPAFNLADSAIVIGVLALLYVIEGRA